MSAGPEGRLVHAVLGWIESRLQDPFSLAGLSVVQADLLGAVTAVGVIGNGGLVFWYEGKDTQHTLRVAEAFDRMELPDVAEALRRSLTFFPGGEPPRTLAEQQGYVSEHRDRLQEAFEPLDRIVFAVDFDRAAARYIVRRREELLAANPSFAAELLRFENERRALVEGLRRACSLLGEPVRSECERMIQRDDLKAVLPALIETGTDLGTGFWRTLAEAARLLGEDDLSKECWRWVRVGSEGALLVEAEFVPAAKLGRDESTGYYSGHKLKWNAGSEPRGLLGASTAELLLVGTNCAGLGERVRVFLVSGGRGSRGLAKGAPIVLHEKGEVVGRAAVIEARAPRA